MIDYSKNHRRRFADEMHIAMEKNKDIFIVTGDLGYGIWDLVRKDFPNRFINVGAAEQSLIGVSIGLALENKIAIAYSITPFLLYRPFETIRNYLHHEKIPVKLIGSGRDKDYLHDGISHWAEEDREVMKIFYNIKSFWPEATDDISKLIPEMIKDNNPWYINLKK